MTVTADRVVHRADLCRVAAFTLRDAGDSPGDGLTIDGHAAVYGRDLRDGEEPTPEAGWASIDSWEGTFWERFRYGAFRKAIRERLPRMQFDHGRHPLLGSLPLGRWTDVTEDQERGLHTVGRLSDNWLVEPFRDAIADGAVDGMSIRFEVVAEEWRDIAGKVIRDDEELMELLWRPSERGPLRRTIREAKLPEAGPVTWPAYESTSVGVRSGPSTVTLDLGRLRDPAQRSLLARAVFLADAASSEVDAPPPTTMVAGGHADPPVVVDGTPRPTDTRTGAPAGEHESRKTPIRDRVDRWRDQAADLPFVEALAEVRTGLALTVKEMGRADARGDRREAQGDRGGAGPAPRQA